MNKKPPQPRITRYDRPAGGWDALRASLDDLREQGILGKGAHTLLRTNQPQGFDCPAVAAEATACRVERHVFATHTVSELARKEDHFLEAQGRLTEPMTSDPEVDRYIPIGWDDAFALFAGELQALDNPDQALFYTSGRTSNEAAFLYQLFVREFSTNNLPDCSNMCHESSGAAMIEQIGTGKGTQLLAATHRRRSGGRQGHRQGGPRSQRDRCGFHRAPNQWIRCVPRRYHGRELVAYRSRIRS